MDKLLHKINHVIVLIFIMSVYSSGVIAESMEKIFYVSKDGNDSWSGELSSPNSDRTNGPFASFDRAKNAIRELKTYGKLQSPVTVMVRGGTYLFDKTFVFEVQDSGSRECPITYKAYPSEKVIITGGKRIRNEWKTHKDKIKVCTIPEVREGGWYFQDLFVNGKRQIRARTPDSGFYHVADVLQGPDSCSAFKYTPGDLKRWINLQDIELVLFHSWDESRLKISDLNEENNIVKLEHASHYPFDKWARQYNNTCARYFVENVFEGLDSPGEWYLNRHTGELYYWPPSGENIEDLEITAPVVKQLVLFQGDTLNFKPVTYITFSGFTFCETDWPEGWEGRWGDQVQPAAITFAYAERCTVKKCNITNVGTYAIEIDGGSAYNVIDKNEISYTGSGGIRIERSPTKRNIISNNHVHHCGIIYPSGVGICVGISAQNVITHNHVHDVGYCGLSCRGPGNIVEYNHVHHVMQKLCDGAGIYLYGEFSDGTIVRNNVFHDIQPYAYFGWGIYLDERTEYVTVMDNIVYRAVSGNTMMHGGRYNIWLNNIFVDAGLYQIFWNPLRDTAYKNIYVNNIFYYTNPDSKLIYLAGTWYDTIIEKSDYNLFYCKGGGPMKIEGIKVVQANTKRVLFEVTTFEDWQKKGFDFHSIIADPLFVDPANDNYTLKEGSPAFKLGFQQIDISTVGPEN